MAVAMPDAPCTLFVKKHEQNSQIKAKIMGAGFALVVLLAVSGATADRKDSLQCSHLFCMAANRRIKLSSMP